MGENPSQHSDDEADDGNQRELSFVLLRHGRHYTDPRRSREFLCASYTRGVTAQKSLLVLVVLAVAAGAGVGVWKAVHAWHAWCRSYAVGVRGEVMRTTDGEFLYFNGTCWTAEQMPPLDTPV